MAEARGREGAKGSAEVGQEEGVKGWEVVGVMEREEVKGWEVAGKEGEVMGWGVAEVMGKEGARGLEEVGRVVGKEEGWVRVGEGGLEREVVGKGRGLVVVGWAEAVREARAEEGETGKRSGLGNPALLRSSQMEWDHIVLCCLQT